MAKLMRALVRWFFERYVRDELDAELVDLRGQIFDAQEEMEELRAQFENLQADRNAASFYF